jgi:hypothetical protein
MFTRKRAAGVKLAGKEAGVSGGSLESGRPVGSREVRRAGVFGGSLENGRPDGVPFRNGPALFLVNLGIGSLENGRD